MATTTLQNLRRELAAYLGYGDIVGKDGSAWTTTTNIGSSTTVASTELRDYGFDDLVGSESGDDLFANWWIIIHGTNNAQAVRRIKNYDASAGQLTVAGTSLTAESGSVDFEIHRYSPSLLLDLVNTARLQAFPVLHKPVMATLSTAVGQTRYQVPASIINKPHTIRVSYGIASDFENQLLTNGDFETWTSSTAASSWTATTLDVAQEELTTQPANYAVYRGSYSARCTSQSSSQGTLAQTISSPSTHSGLRLNLSIWVHCLTASVVSTRIYLNSSETLGTAADGGLHTGSGWELLTSQVDAAVTISSLTVGISVVSTATDNTEFYVDEAILTAGPMQEPERTGDALRNWDYIPVMEGTTLRNEIVFPYEFGNNYRLRFEGQAYLSSLSSESDTIEISKPQTELLLAYTTAELFKRRSQQSPDSDDDYDARRYAMSLAEIERLSTHYVRGPRRRLGIPDQGW